MTAAVIHLHEWEHPCALCGVRTRVEFLDKHDAYGSTACPDCFEAIEAELHIKSCTCRHCVARRAAFRARLSLARRRKIEAERDRLREIGAIVVDENGKEDLGW